jgi:hypothetical protein
MKGQRLLWPLYVLAVLPLTAVSVASALLERCDIAVAGAFAVGMITIQVASFSLQLRQQEEERLHYERLFQRTERKDQP